MKEIPEKAIEMVLAFSKKTFNKAIWEDLCASESGECLLDALNLTCSQSNRRVVRKEIREPFLSAFPEITVDDIAKPNPPEKVDKWNEYKNSDFWTRDDRKNCKRVVTTAMTVYQDFKLKPNGPPG